MFPISRAVLCDDSGQTRSSIYDIPVSVLLCYICPIMILAGFGAFDSV